MCNFNGTCRNAAISSITLVALVWCESGAHTGVDPFDLEQSLQTVLDDLNTLSLKALREGRTYPLDETEPEYLCVPPSTIMRKKRRETVVRSDWLFFQMPLA
jgi:hypothetical protein